MIRMEEIFVQESSHCVLWNFFTWSPLCICRNYMYCLRCVCSLSCLRIDVAICLSSMSVANVFWPGIRWRRKCSHTVANFTSCVLWTEQRDERCCTHSASLRCHRVWDGIDMQIESRWLAWALFLMFRRHIFTPCTYIGTFFFHSVYDEVVCYAQWTIKMCLLRSVYTLQRNVGTNVIDCDLLFTSAE